MGLNLMLNNHSYFCFKYFPLLSLDDVSVLSKIGYHPTNAHRNHAQIARKTSMARNMWEHPPTQIPKKHERERCSLRKVSHC